MMKLYMIKDGTIVDNLDLFVIAESRVQAVQLWNAYYELEDCEPNRVFELPSMMGEARALTWHEEVTLA